MKTITSTLALTLAATLLAGCFLTDDKDSNGNDETLTVALAIQDTLRYLTIGEPESEEYDTLGIGVEEISISPFEGLDSATGMWISGGYFGGTDSTLINYWVDGRQPGTPPDTTIKFLGYQCSFSVSGNTVLELEDSLITTSIVFSEIREHEERRHIRILFVDEEASSPEGFDSVNFVGRPFNGTLSITCPLP